MDLIIDPPRRVGPIEIGMPFGEVESILLGIPGFVRPSPGEKYAPGFAHYESEMSISVDPGIVDRVQSVEIHRPLHGVDVWFGDISVFNTPASDVIDSLSKMTVIEIKDEGLTVIAPNLLLALGRSVLPESPIDDYGRYFESVLVAAPGYYD